MLQAKESLLILAVPVLLGGILLAMGGGKTERDYSTAWQAPQFEFTIWTDTLADQRFANVPVVHISDREAARASMVVLRNEKDHLPVRELRNKRFGLLMLGEQVPVFEAYISRYVSLDTVLWSESCSEVSVSPFDSCTHLIVSVNQSTESAYDLEALIRRLERHTEVIVACFDPYQVLRQVTDHHSLILAPNPYQVSQEASAQLIFGGQAFGRGIPADISQELDLSASYSIPKIRLGYSDPEYVGISSDTLAEIDRIISEGIQSFAMPGCQVLVAKEGQVVYHKSFGYHSYQQERPVRLDDLYDVASITKVAATTLASMKMVEEGSIDLEGTIGDYLHQHGYQKEHRIAVDTFTIQEWEEKVNAEPSLATMTIRPFRDSLILANRVISYGGKEARSKVFDITIEELLTHTSGLRSGLNIYPYQRMLRSPMYHTSFSNQYSVPVAQNFYLDRSYLDSLWNDTKAMEPDSAGYRYSCVNMILLQRVMDSLNRIGIGDYLDQEFYRELGLQTTGYTPLRKFSADRIAPTSSDRWRGQLLCGTVHDPTAALFGGVSGNAGLFSNAHDLGILGQLWLNGGSYGGHQFLKEETVDLFTRRTRGHRGLGFDMPPRGSSYLLAESASLSTYGHTGFTGTCIWVDPEHELVFVFLSNRIHPSVNNTRLNEMRIRQRVHQVVYRAMGVPADPFRMPGPPSMPGPGRGQNLAREVVFAP